ncbi:hypothetical protein ACINWCA157_1276 [Acinetobacter radioresistens WC-A-157]|nr:hypothetical protein ACINWCA157_1276 [Acinetobacter radioresistens WC-A-157]
MQTVCSESILLNVLLKALGLSGGICPKLELNAEKAVKP